MTWTSVGPEPLGFLNNNNPPTSAITTNGVGNLIVCLNTLHVDAGVYPTGMSSSRVTWAKVPGTDVQDMALIGSGLAANSPWSGNIWFGTVNSVGSDTVTFSYTGGTVPGRTNCVMQEFHSTVGSWSMDTWTFLNSAGTNTWPSMTAAGPGEIYMGFAWNSGASSGGPTSPWVVNANSDSQSNAMAYNLNYTSGTSPVFSDSTETYGLMVLIAEGSAPSGPQADLAVRQQNPLLAWPYQQRMPRGA